MSKLFISLEDEELTIPSEQDTAKAEMEQLEHNEIIQNTINELSSDVDTAGQSLVAIESLENISRSLHASVANNKGIDEGAAKLAAISCERICNILGYRHDGVLIPAHESFASNTSFEASKYALESIGDMLTRAWEAIKEFFVRIWEHIKKFWKELTTAIGRRQKAAKKSLKRIEDMRDSAYGVDAEKATKVLKAKSREVLKYQNAFRTESSTTTPDNAVSILTTHKKLVNYEVPNIDIAKDEKDLGELLKVLTAEATSVHDFFTEMKDATFVDGYKVIVNNDNNNYSVKLTSTIPAATKPDESNNQALSLNELEQLLELTESLINDAEEFVSDSDKYKTSFDSYISLTESKLKEASNLDTSNDELRAQATAVMDGYKTMQTAMNALFVTGPGLTLRAIDNALGYADLHMDLYSKT